MPIDDISPRLRELGRLKIGAELEDRPSTLDAWRMTSHRLDLLEAAGALYGGVPEPLGDEFELFTEAPELDVLLPAQDVAGGQWWELWTAGGLQRRCTGSAIVVFEPDEPDGFRRIGPCICDTEPGDRRACKPTTVLRVILPELPDLGVWRLTTRSRWAATELPSAAAMLTAGHVTAPAVLAIDHRETKRPGEPRKPFVVPVLRTRSTVAELIARSPRGEGLGGPDEPPRAIARGGSTTEDAETAQRPALGPSNDRANARETARSQRADEDARSGPSAPVSGPPADSAAQRPPDPVPEEWRALIAFLDAHPPGQVSGEDPAGLIADLEELEGRMLAVGLWRPAEDGTLPLDAAAAKREEFAGRDWRGGDLLVATLKTFTQRAFLAAAAEVDGSETGARARRQLRREHQ